MAEQTMGGANTWHASSSTDNSLASSRTAVASLYPQMSNNCDDAPKANSSHNKLDGQYELKDLSTSTRPNIPPAEPVEELHPQSSSQNLSPWRLAVVIASLSLSTCLVALDTSIIGVAVPKISTVFGALDDIAWYGSAYLLTTTAFQPIYGKIYKFYSIKRTYLASIFIFEVGSIVCAAAPSSRIFILGRAIAGAGAAGVFQGCLDVIGLVVPLKQRPMYVGIVMGVYSFSFCLGPVLGGVFTDKVDWRWCFWINVPIGVTALFVSSIILNVRIADAVHNQSTLRDTLRHLDLFGTALFIGAMVCLLLAFQWAGQTVPWSSVTIIGLFVGFVVLIIGFGILQIRHGENATIPLRILRKRSVWAGALFLFFLAMMTFILSYYIPLFFQAVQSTSATESGVRYFALVLPQSAAMVVMGAIVVRWGYYVPYIVLGDVLCVVGTGLLTRISIGTSAVAWAAYLTIVGLGIGIGMQLPYAALQVALSESDIAIGNAISVFAWQLGGGLVLSAAQTLFLNDLLRQVPQRTHTVAPEEVIRAGAFGLQSLAPDTQTLRELQDAYSSAVNKPLIMALVAACFALPFALSMEWLNVKVVAEEKIERAEQELASTKGV